MLYVLGIGSPTHPVSGHTWGAWKLPMVGVGDYRYVGGGPLFIHQYPQAWIDLRDRGGKVQASPGGSTMIKLFSILLHLNYRVNYYANSVAATRAQQENFSKNLSREFPAYSANVWGVTASDSSMGYTDWGASPTDSRIDGTVVPSGRRLFDVRSRHLHPRRPNHAGQVRCEDLRPLRIRGRLQSHDRMGEPVRHRH